MPLFSGNCHLLEPADTFVGRVSSKWADRIPKLVDNDEGGQSWIFEREVRPLRQVYALAGKPVEVWSTDPMRMDDMRPGAYDARERLLDMDLDGVDCAAILSSPASIGFNADLFGRTSEADLGHELIRAWNDWYFENWLSVSPQRFVGVGCASYFDPREAAKEVERNAARGFKCVSFRNPVDLGSHWVGTGHWDPFFRACEETGTVVFHHTEMNDGFPRRLDAERTPYPYGMVTSLFQACAMEFVNSMIWGGVPVRFPKLKIQVAESGGSWIPHYLKHATWTVDYTAFTRKGWPGGDLRPLDLLRRSFVFSTLELEEALALERDYGITGWMIEDDYPHCESVWPNTKSHFGAQLDGVPAEHVERLAWRNASELYRHPVPAEGYVRTPTKS